MSDDPVKNVLFALVISFAIFALAGDSWVKRAAKISSITPAEKR